MFPSQKSVSPQPAAIRSLTPILMMAAGILLIATAVIMVLNQPTSANAHISAPRIGGSLANFTLTDLNGNPAQLSDYQGKVVLLNIWATWCPPCQSEMPDLQAAYSVNKDKGFVILAIDAGDALPDVQSFVKEYNLSFPVLLDPQIELIKRMGIYDYPTSVLIGRDGIVKNIQIGLYPPERLKADIAPYLTK